MKIFYWILGIVVFIFAGLIGLGLMAQSGVHDEYVAQCTANPTRHPNQQGVCECAAEQFTSGMIRNHSDEIGEWYGGARTFYDLTRLYGEEKMLKDVMRCNKTVY